AVRDSGERGPGSGMSVATSGRTGYRVEPMPEVPSGADPQYNDDQIVSFNVRDQAMTAFQRSARATALLAIFALGLGGCANLSHTQRGAIIGATTGAAAGGVIGKATGSTARGAIIGAAVGGAA